MMVMMIVKMMVMMEMSVAIVKTVMMKVVVEECDGDRDDMQETRKRQVCQEEGSCDLSEDPGRQLKLEYGLKSCR